jgi:hypothetical protein
LKGAEAGVYQRFSVTTKGREVVVRRNDVETHRFTLPEDAPARGSFGLGDTGAEAQFMNLYVRDL